MKPINMWYKISTLIVLHQQVLVSLQECCTFPSGTQEHNGSCYYFSPSEANHADASAYCSKYHYHLAFIESAEEQDYIRTYMEENNIGDCWMGLTVNSNKEGVWLDGSSLTYENFQSDSFNEGGECFRISTSKWHDYRWHDRGCSYTFRYICEREVVECSTTTALATTELLTTQQSTTEELTTTSTPKTQPTTTEEHTTTSTTTQQPTTEEQTTTSTTTTQQLTTEELTTMSTTTTQQPTTEEQTTTSTTTTQQTTIEEQTTTSTTTTQQPTTEEQATILATTQQLTTEEQTTSTTTTQQPTTEEHTTTSTTTTQQPTTKKQTTMLTTTQQPTTEQTTSTTTTQQPTTEEQTTTFTTTTQQPTTEEQTTTSTTTTQQPTTEEQTTMSTTSAVNSKTDSAFTTVVSKGRQTSNRFRIIALNSSIRESAVAEKHTASTLIGCASVCMTTDACSCFTFSDVDGECLIGGPAATKYSENLERRTGAKTFGII